MCSWCWAFRPLWHSLKEQLPEQVNVTYLLGGLAPDSKLPMQPELQQQIEKHWRTIQKRVPGTKFNFEFWQRCTPRRSTYPACRAVIAVRAQDALIEDAMLLAIQQAYYLQARNPSDDDVLITCAGSIGLDEKQFASDLNSPETEQQLLHEIALSRSIGAHGFPSLILEKEGCYHPIAVDYRDAARMLNEIHHLLSEC
ncbi:DsbA family protein [Mariprofundus sp. NF]|uniref:DsbA family protein n=1 Tax=Mariprofundus sp. NF TaxID=2608716 RepID=UPI0015A13F53|nr:DsbA family protein [Mariprofundus sp. NF]NWF39727.1 DsbA family protein [Mariprofundus sp. NF]